MKNKGFTLIELLAVIVILALIALVTIPMINNVIEKAKKGALEDSVYGLKSAAELYYSTTGTSETIEFNCDESGCINGDKKLPFKGSVEDGKVKLFSDGKVSICLTSDGYGSSILADEKKVTTKMGGCDEETYKVSEVIAIEKYNNLKDGMDLLTTALYDKTIISSKENTFEKMASEVNELDLNQGEAANKKTIVEGLQYSELGITEDMSWEEIKETLLKAYPELPIGTTYNFAYTGGIQTWTAQATGLYKLDVYGASGGNLGGAGGFSSGYVELKKGEILYIVCGGSGSYSTGGAKAGGYNGGGSGWSRTSGEVIYGGSGGGATHIAKVSGILSSIGYENFVTNKQGIIVAGGGGGGISAAGTSSYGGTGGGANGGVGTQNGSDSAVQGHGAGGTQTSGGAIGGSFGTPLTSGSFGTGGSAGYVSNNIYANGCGGGAGLYGGGASSGGAGGGSGYIGGVPEIEYNGTIYSPTTSNGANTGNGKAVITYIAS